MSRMQIVVPMSGFGEHLMIYAFLSIGNPVFTNRASHPYHMELDGRMPKEALPLLEARYQAVLPKLPSENIL